eukprot:6410875-Prymnesium_polylepis.1
MDHHRFDQRRAKQHGNEKVEVVVPLPAIGVANDSTAKGYVSFPKPRSACSDGKRGGQNGVEDLYGRGDGLGWRGGWWAA